MMDLHRLINLFPPFLILIIFSNIILSNKLQYKINKVASYFLVISISFILFIGTSCLKFNNFISFYIITIAMLILYNLIFEGSVPLKSIIIVITIQFFLISILSTSITYYILYFLSIDFFCLVPLVNFITKFYDLFQIIFSIILLSYLYSYINLYLDIYYKTLKKAKFLLIFSGINFILYNSLLYVYCFFSKYNSVDKLHMILMFILPLSFVIIILLLIISKILSDKYTIKSYLDTLENQLNIQLHHYEAFEEYLNKSKIVVHDTKHHILAIEVLLENNKFEEAQEYIKEIEKDLFTLKKRRICDNKIVDAVLQYTLDQCSKKNIEFIHDVAFPKRIDINNTALTVIFGNLLKNSIESCCAVDNQSIKKYISITGKIVNNNLVVKIINSQNKKAIFNSNGLIKTTKQNKYTHGIGILSVKNSINKCNGNIVFKSDSNKFEVFFSIPLNEA